MEKEFKINDFITLKLENQRTNIYINSQLFRQCKYLLVNIIGEEIREFDYMDSIDDLEAYLNHDLERNNPIKYDISPEVEFWAHCSNLQTWAENNYDTRILHSNLAFPLLRNLVKCGDLNARTVYKDEIAERFVCGSNKIKFLLLSERYFGALTREESSQILNEKMWLENLGDNDVDSLILKGMAYRKLRDYDNAIQYYNKVLKLDPKNIVSMEEKAEIYMMMNKNKKAIKQYTAIIDNLKKDHLTSRRIYLLNIASQYNEMNDLNKALETINNVLSIKKDYITALGLKGKIMMKMGNCNEAERLFSTAFSIENNNPVIWNYKGISYHKLKNYRKAEICYKKALSADKNYAVAWYNLACIYSIKNESEKCLYYLTKAALLEDRARPWTEFEPDFDNMRNDPDFKELIS